MAIDVFWQTEFGDVVEKWPDGKATINHLMYEHDITGTLCLRFVDPYGLTNFNNRQIPVLIAELESVIDRYPQCELSNKIECLVDFLKRSLSSRAHIVFRGD